jgi:hypothetical protein
MSATWSSTPAAAADPSLFGWILQHDSTNGVVWDPHWSRLAARTTPRFDLGPTVYRRRLLAHFEAGMGGPPDPVRIVDDRYIVLGACVPHDCGDKAFLWIDPVDDLTIGAIASAPYQDEATPSPIVFSRSVSCVTLPGRFRTAFDAWLIASRIKPGPIGFVGRDGKLDPHCLA